MAMTEAEVREKCDYVEENGEPGWKCRKCGSWIMAKDQSCSVWLSDGPGPCAGTGEVRHRTVCWCPTCHPEPKDRDIISESLGENIARGLF